MNLDVSRALKNPGQVFPFETGVDLEALEVLGDPVRFTDIEVAGEYLSSGDNRISLKARIRAQADTRCSRCLEPVRIPAEAAMDVVFAKAPDPEDPDLYGFEAADLDLTASVRDALLLELPMRILCAEDCRGLCPVCGINLNRETCTCQEGAEVIYPFSALKKIVLNNEEV